MTLLVAAFLILVILAVAAFAFSRRIARRTGLPAGQLVYSDTGFAIGRVGGLERNAEGEKVEKPLVSRRFGLVGRPDYLIRVKNGVIPVEVKSAKSPASGIPYDSHLFQLAAYCLLVEDVLQSPVPFGVIRYRDAEMQIDFTEELRMALLDVLDEMQKARQLTDVHRSHDEPRRCANCWMRDVCEEAL